MGIIYYVLRGVLRVSANDPGVFPSSQKGTKGRPTLVHSTHTPGYVLLVVGI